MDSKAFKGKGKGLSKIDASADLTRNEARRKLASNISGCFTKGFKRAEPGCEDEPTRHVCVMGVARSDDGILRDCCQGYGEVSDISRNEKVSKAPRVLLAILQSTLMYILDGTVNSIYCTPDSSTLDVILLSAWLCCPVHQSTV